MEIVFTFPPQCIFTHFNYWKLNSQTNILTIKSMESKTPRVLRIEEDAIQGRRSGIAVVSYCATPALSIQIILKSKDDR